VALLLLFFSGRRFLSLYSPIAVYLQCVFVRGGVQFLPTLHEGHPFVSCIIRHLGPVLPPHATPIPRKGNQLRRPEEGSMMYVCGNSDADQKRLSPWMFVETAKGCTPNFQEGMKKGLLQK
jgi:hypothetical protein